MGIIRRLILLFYVLLVLATTIICAGVCLKFIPADVWQNELNHIITRQETLIALAIMAAASLILLRAVFSRNGNKLSIASGDVHLERGKPGEVKVAVPAIVNVVERAAITINGVREAQATVYQQSGDMPIKIRLTIALGQGFSAPRVSEATVASVNEALQTALELSGVPVEVRVEEVIHAITERDRRVV